jgi:hypothetical protein
LRNSELIALLRHPATVRIDDAAAQPTRQPIDPDEDELGAARGIAVAILLSVALWRLIDLGIGLALK